MPIKKAFQTALLILLIAVLVADSTTFAQTDGAGPLFKRGLMLFRQNKFVSARLDFKDIIDNYNSSEYVVPSHMMLAKIYFNLGDYKLAESTAAEHRVLYTTSPYFDWTFYLTAACSFKMGNISRAAEILADLAAKTNNAQLRSRALSTLKYIIMPAAGSETVVSVLSKNGIDPARLEPVKRFEPHGSTADGDSSAPPITAQSSLQSPRQTTPQISATHQQTQPQRTLRNVFQRGEVPKIGLLAPLTGINADMGKSLLSGVQATFANKPLVNNRPIELVVEDTKSNPVTAVLKTRKLARDGVIAIIGPIMSESTIPAAVESQSLGIPFIAPTTTTANLTGIGNYIFQLNFNPVVQAEALANLAYDSLNFTHFAVIADNDPWGITFFETVIEEMEKRGAVNVGSDIIVEELSDSSDRLFTKIRESAPHSTASTDSMVIFNIESAFPDTVFISQEVLLSEERRPMPIETIDCIFVSAPSEEAIRIASLIMEYNIRTVILGDSGWWSNRRAFRGNERYIEGAIIVASERELLGGEDSSYNPSVSESTDPNNIPYTKGADACRLLIHSLQNGADDPGSLVSMLETIKGFEGISTDISIDPERHTNNAVGFVHVLNGRNYELNVDTINNQINTITGESFETDKPSLPVIR